MKKLFIILGTLLCLVLSGSLEMTAMAETDEGTFRIEAELLPSGKTSYNIRLTIENSGSDWEGTARLRLYGSYSVYDCAYDTTLSLPQGTTKQFVVKVPKASIDQTNGTVVVTLLDHKSQIDAEEEFKRLLIDENNTLTMGILSDDYPALTYLDMGGKAMEYGSNYYPIILMELNQDNLISSLDALNLLVIDQFNTGVLTDEQIEEIDLWIEDGGVLIVGTGSYAEDTLMGLDCGIECRRILETDAAYDNGYLDMTQIKLADLEDINGLYYEKYVSMALACSMGSGAVGVLPYALTDLGRLDASGYLIYEQENFVYTMLRDIITEASARYGMNSNSSTSYILLRLLRTFGNAGNRLNFGVLKVLVIVYVIFVGPVLYLILRLFKKRDLYWVAVPVTALVGIFLVFWAGRGFEVVGTSVYSVTVEDLAGKESSRAYLHCYDASHKEWDLCLADRFESAGSLGSGYSYYNTEDDYYYHIKKDGDRLFFGINPESSFEDGYFCAEAVADKDKTEGSISWDVTPKVYLDNGIMGTITNDTNQDFMFFAVVIGDNVYIYENLPAGETYELPLGMDPALFNGPLDWYFLYIPTIYGDWEAEKIDAMNALGTGVVSVYTQMDQDETAVIGVTPDWEKVVDDSCNEVSYGCLYMIQ